MFGQRLCDSGGFKNRKYTSLLFYSILHFSGPVLDIIYPHVLDPMGMLFQCTQKLFCDILLLSLFTFQQEMLNISKKSASCFVNFSRLQQITNIQAEINQVNYVELFTLYFQYRKKKILVCSTSNSLALRTASSTQPGRCLLTVVNSSCNSNSSSQQQQQELMARTPK